MSSPSQRPPSRFPPVEESTPWTAWVFGGAAGLVALLAGYLFFSDREPTPPAEPAEPPPSAPLPSAEASAPVVLPASPLDFSRRLGDARQRALLWDGNAALTGVHLVIENGAPRGPVELEFGVPRGTALPGTPVGQRRLLVAYEGERATERTLVATSVARTLAEPNCPLEVAFRKLREAGVETSGLVTANFLHSERADRALFTFTVGTVTHKVDADSCALLLR